RRFVPVGAQLLLRIGAHRGVVEVVAVHGVRVRSAAGRRRRSAAPCATVSGSTAARAGAARGAVARRPAPVARGTAALRCAARPRAARPRWSARLRATSQETRRTERHERTPCETDGEGAGHRTGYTITPTGEGGCLPL